jgi:hypothetical protein
LSDFSIAGGEWASSNQAGRSSLGSSRISLSPPYQHGTPVHDHTPSHQPDHSNQSKKTRRKSIDALKENRRGSQLHSLSPPSLRCCLASYSQPLLPRLSTRDRPASIFRNTRLSLPHNHSEAVEREMVNVTYGGLSPGATEAEPVLNPLGTDFITTLADGTISCE